jgi:hypothetical protein
VSKAHQRLLMFAIWMGFMLLWTQRIDPHTQGVDMMFDIVILLATPFLSCFMVERWIGWDDLD